MIKIIFSLIFKIYKFFLSPFISSSCKFYPTCSDYFLFLIFKYDFLVFLFFFFKRLFKCNFFFKGGYDPVP